MIYNNDIHVAIVYSQSPHKQGKALLYTAEAVYACLCIQHWTAPGAETGKSQPQQRLTK